MAEGPTARNKQRLGRLFQAIRAGDTPAVEGLVAPNCIQHNPREPDGRQALTELYRVPRGLDAQVFRVIAERDLVATHGYLPASNTAVIDINRFDPGGKVVEHWDVRQPAVTRTASGNTMFDGGGNSDAPTTAQQLAANKAVVDRLYEIQRSGDADRLGEVIAADYIQHDPQVPSGLVAAQAFLRGTGPVDITTHRMLADGDLVLAHFTAQHLVGAEIFRIADDKIMERWGILQAIPPTTVSGNDMVSQLS